MQIFVGMWDYYDRYLYSVTYLGPALSESQGLHGHSMTPTRHRLPTPVLLQSTDVMLRVVQVCL